MRIDLYLKTSRLIKRRTLASKACSKGLVLINNKVAKPSSLLKLEDVITLNLAAKQIVVKVTSLTLLKNDLMYELISESYHH
ncbi:MAG TPA: RNA-binding S4 domain-containing protein [Acholeplasmataceae bacterium]|nr:RNA-binding S4 domain-containing protein [Acholeplasmataceae bacterium]